MDNRCIRSNTLSGQGFSRHHRASIQDTYHRPGTIVRSNFSLCWTHKITGRFSYQIVTSRLVTSILGDNGRQESNPILPTNRCECGKFSGASTKAADMKHPFMSGENEEQKNRPSPDILRSFVACIRTLEPSAHWPADLDVAECQGSTTSMQQAYRNCLDGHRVPASVTVSHFCTTALGHTHSRIHFDLTTFLPNCSPKD